MYKTCVFFVLFLVGTYVIASKKNCKKNERYVECDAICDARTCKEAGFPVPCQINATCPGKPGCVCTDGFLKNDDGDCIPRAKCPSCGGDDNAFPSPSCGSPCGRRVCGNHGRSRRCALYCLTNACDCNRNYLLDRKTEKCVLPEDCSL